jgi:exosortase E/protease (VPEID-CTERM system)
VDGNQHKDSPNYLALVVLAALFFAECELLLRMPVHHEVRKALRALIGIPAHDIMFAALVFLALAKVLSKGRIPEPVGLRFSSGFLIIHLAYTLVLEFTLLPLHALFQARPSLVYLWWPILLGYALSWLGCVARPSRWLKNLKLFGPWLFAAVAVGGFSVYFSKFVAEYWYGMPTAAMWLSERWLLLFFDDVSRGPGKFELGTSEFRVGVGAPCSGYEGMGLVLCYAGAYLALRRDALKFPGALLLLPIGVVLSWVANTMRIACLIAIGHYISPKLAMDGFHSQAGWLTFTVISLVLVAAVEQLGLFRKEKTPLNVPALPFLAPLIALFVVQIASSAMTNLFDFYYPLRVVIVGAVLFHFREHYRDFLGYISRDSVVCGLVVYVLWLLLAKEHPADAPSDFLAGGLLTGWLAFRVIGAVVVVPLVEELAFRGYLLRRLQSVDFDQFPYAQLTPISVLASSLVFGLLHQDWVAATVAGICYALVLRRSGTLADAIVAHAVTNLCLAVQVVALGQWGYW